MAPKYFYSCGHRLRHCMTNEGRKKERLNERDRKKKKGKEEKKKQTNNCREGSAEHRAPGTDFPISKTIRGIGRSFRRNDA